MQFTGSNVIDQTGIHYFAYRITRDLGHICRLNQGPDVGIDATIEIVSGWEATGAYVAIQIKSTSDRDMPIEFTHYVDDRHKKYWMSHSIPMLYAVVAYEDGKIWIRQFIEDHVDKTDKHWKISFAVADEIANSGKDLFEKLARPDPSDAVMRRISRIKEKLGYYSEGVVISGQEELAKGIELMNQINRELQLLLEFTNLDRARYGQVVLQDIENLVRRASNYDRDMSQSLNSDINGM